MSTSALRVGVVGVGVMGADHADRLVHRIAGATLVAVSDPDTARAAALAARYDGVRAIPDPLDLIADEGVDAVLIASPGFVHEEQVLACVAHGKYTLCEKPLTMDSESALRVVEAERKAGSPLIQVGFMRRFDPEYAEMKRLLEAGGLGRLLLVHNVHRNKSVGDSFRSEMIVRDSLVHEVDVCRWLFDDEIDTITVLAPKPTGRAADGILDPQVAIFRMAGGGMATTEVFVNSQVGYEVRCEAVAECGNVTIGLGQSVFVRRDNRYGGYIPDDFRDRFGRAYDLEVQAWVDACRRGDVVGPTAWDGYAAVAVCTAGMQSLATGQPVRVDLVDRAEVYGGADT
ncbi:Gfo/Idh/MocA family oxidoreductase [Planosporangium thailandense]|uniref:Inositol 2-dehydrogenase n=1 Tax=Planosporangium thailandense TaxID=765197 RepID=A0ABX0XYZ1_9ACTN|nr:Gfo/Idh/MocA family oxidoreductase [Planosporangium thailandense]NJC70585.1 Gfo/Idh/MocA family oxidoreductase [Planosporangium thailandense]